MPIRLAFCLLALLLSLSFAKTEQLRFEHAGLERSYLLDLPEAPAEGILLALHDAASSAHAFKAMTDLTALANELNLLLIYPNSAGILWDNGIASSGLETLFDPRDDLGFIDKIIQEVKAKHKLEQSSVHMVGFAEGGSLAFHYACQRPNQVDKVMIVGSLLWPFQAEACLETETPPSLLMIHGTEDTRCPITGRNLLPRGEGYFSLNLRESFEFWRSHAACNENQKTETASSIRLSNCRNNTELGLIMVQDAGHHWMQQNQTLNSTNFNTESIFKAFLEKTDWQNQLPEQAKLEQDGPARSYFVYVPEDYDETHAYALVMVLHGRPGNGPGIAYITDMISIAEQNKFIVVFPEAYDSSWNYVQGLPNYPELGSNDVEFLKNLSIDLGQDFNIDTNKLYITGFSNGGFMTELMACTATDTFAAFAIVGATYVPEMVSACAKTKPAPILFMHGTKDVSIPFEGIKRSDVHYHSMPAMESLFMWVTRNRCTAAPDIMTLPKQDNSDTFVRTMMFRNCETGQDLEFYMIENGGHNWPGVPNRISPEIAGIVNEDIHAGQVIWEFFERHPKQP